MSEGFSTIAEELQSLRRWRRQVCSVQVHVLCMLSRSASLWKRNLRQSSHAAACLTSAQQKFAGTWHVEMNSSLHMSKGQQNSAVWPEKFILSLRADCRPRLQAEPGKEVRCCPRNQYIGVYIGGGPQPCWSSTEYRRECHYNRVMLVLTEPSAKAEQSICSRAGRIHRANTGATVCICTHLSSSCTLLVLGRNATRPPDKPRRRWLAPADGFSKSDFEPIMQRFKNRICAVCDALVFLL